MPKKPSPEKRDSTMAVESKEWWQEADRWKRWGEIFLSPDNSYNPETGKEVDFLERNILDGKDEHILDVCCGFGRHTIELAKRGHSVRGLDISKPLLSMGREYARGAGVPVEFIEGDMTKLPFKGELDVILNLFQSFGYFSDPEKDEVALKGFAAALKDSGRLFIDLRNPGYVFSSIRNGKPMTLPHESVVDGRKIAVTEHMDDATKRWITNWDWPEDGKSWSISIRLYDFEEMKTMLESAGFSIDKVWGGWDGEPFEAETSQRLMILAKKESHAS